ncbi:hypothetical protein Acr_24g0006290 [Actinidia rufa]|uniref:Uncharacterized protein n=1 Tax=Actinidia rufa TaxID=165716 RepID=A0A7J0GUD1_9ERIC|nr:hypothetical protein Acr_24g0006290 [Actinidia rufa]
MEKETDNLRNFNMDALQTNLPQKKRGLSRYYPGKARSFVCMAEVRYLEDLKKQEHSKKRKKHSERQGMPVPPLSCSRLSSTQCAYLWSVNSTKKRRISHVA